MEKSRKSGSIISLILIAGTMITVWIIRGNSSNNSIERTKYKTKEFEFTLEDAPEKIQMHDLLAQYQPMYPVKNPWMFVHWQCLKNDVRKSPRFLGVGNTLYVGTIWQKDFTSTRTTLENLGLSEQEMKRIVKRGQPSSCGVSRLTGIDIHAFLDLDTNYFNKIDLELGAFIKTSKKTEVVIESFVPIDLLTGDFIDMLDSSKDNTRKKYLRWFNEPGNLICTWTYEVNGMSVLVESEDTIGGNLKAKLQNNLQSPPVDLQLRTGFKYVNNKTIQISTSQPFYVIGGVKKVMNVKPKK